MEVLHVALRLACQKADSTVTKKDQIIFELKSYDGIRHPSIFEALQS